MNEHLWGWRGREAPTKSATRGLPLWHDRRFTGPTGSGATVERSRFSRVFGAFLGLVADTGPAGRADGTADDRPRRAGDRAADQGTRGPATERARPRTGFVVALGRLTGDRAGHRAYATADDGTDRATNGCTDRGATERPGAGSDGLGAMLPTIAIDRIDRGVEAGVIAGEARVARGQRVVVRMIVRIQCVVLVVHLGSPVRLGPATSPETGGGAG
jgi:hypothetical protein